MPLRGTLDTSCRTLRTLHPRLEDWNDGVVDVVLRVEDNHVRDPPRLDFVNPRPTMIQESMLQQVHNLNAGAFSTLNLHTLKAFWGSRQSMGWQGSAEAGIGN